MPDIQQARRDRLRPAIAALDADAALVTSPANVRYLTGLASSNAAVLVPAAGTAAVLATDSRYALTASRDCGDLELLTERDIEPALARLAAGRGLRRVAFEAHEMTVERHHAFAAAAAGHGAPLSLVPLGRAVERLRMVKDEAEIALLAQACAITSRALADLLAGLRPGQTEAELAGLLERRMGELGAQRPAFETIVASGPNGAIPHHVPGGRAVRRGDLVTIDCGARYGGYHADLTRTVAIGEPAGWQREIYDLVAAAQQAGIAAAVPGADVGGVDEAARSVIAAGGHAEHFTHGLGHGVGLEIHEAPIMGYGRAGTLEDRVPITVEPGIYLPGRGGVRIEDTLVVRAGSGTAAPHDILTTTTRELTVL